MNRQRRAAWLVSCRVSLRALVIRPSILPHICRSSSSPLVSFGAAAVSRHLSNTPAKHRAVWPQAEVYNDARATTTLQKSTPLPPPRGSIPPPTNPTTACSSYCAGSCTVERGCGMSTQKFTIEIEQEQDQRWIAEVPELPGVMAYGSSPDDARAKVQALALRVLADRLEHGESVPELLHISFEAA